MNAEVLFNEGRRLMAAKNYEAACGKFADSEALDPAPGTALNLALCYQKAGKLATAWAAFQSAQTIAERAGQADRARAAKKAAAAIEPRLSRLSLSVADADTPGLAIACDDRPIPRSEWSIALPLDGGSHVVTAAAPGRLAWRTQVDLKDSEQRLSVDVPPLEKAPAPVAATPVASPAPAPAAALPSSTSAGTAQAQSEGEAPGRPQRIIGLVTAGAGVVTMGVAGALMIVARSKYDAANDEHNDSRATDSASAVHLANTGGVVLGIGAGVAAAGAIVWLVAPSAAVTVGTDGHAVLVRGVF